MRIRTASLFLLLAVCLLADDSAWDLYERGRAAEKAGKMAQAYLLYSQAAAIEPKNRTYWLRSLAVRSRAALEAKTLPPEVATDQMEDLPPDADPPAPVEPASYQDLKDAARPLPELRVQESRRDFDLRGDSKKLFEDVAKAYGLDCVFDGDYQPLPNIHFDLHDVTYREALHGLEAATASFLVPLNSRMFLVARDTPQKRNEVEPTVAVAIPLPEAAVPADFTAMITAVQQALALEKVSFDTQNNTVIIRDRISKIGPARALFEDLLQPKAQIAVDVQFIQISRNDMLTYGFDLPNVFSLNFLTTWMQNTFTLPSSIQGLLTFGGGKTLMGLGIMNAEFVAKMSQGTGKVLLDAQLRGQNGAPSTIHVGDRYPILQAGYYGPASFFGTGTSAAYTPPPQFTYADLGFSLKVIPVIHNLEDVSLDIDTQFQVLTGASSNGIPVIANRSMKSTVRLKMGEWAAIAGLLDTKEARNIAGIAGLSRVPYLNLLTSMHEKDTSTDEVVILIRPHPLTLPPGENYMHTYRLGSDTRPITPL